MSIFIPMDLFACPYFMMVSILFIIISRINIEWSAALTVSSVCMSIISMLNSAKKKIIFLNN